MAADIKNEVRDKLVSGWLHYSWAFLEIAELACRQVLESDRYQNARIYIAISYNLRHSLEVFLKRLIVSFGKPVDKALKSHDLVFLANEVAALLDSSDLKAVIEDRYKNLSLLSSIDRANIEIANEDLQKLSHNMELLDSAAKRLQKCQIFLDANDGVEINDFTNTIFKYPEGSNKHDLDCENFVESLTKKDFDELLKDIMIIKALFQEVGFLFRIYANCK